VLKVLQACCDINAKAKEQRLTSVKEGVIFILRHFEGRQPIFPRKMSTSLSQERQFTVYNEKQILNECIKANFIDCRLNAYPVLSDDGKSAAAIQAPNLIFIDIDLPQSLDYENSLLELNNIQSRTLNLIKHKLDGCSPTVLWTGNGYHIYIVLDTRPLELITDLFKLSREPSKEFLKFAEIIFTNKKADSKHNHSFSSYLLRIPHTFNSKCNARGTDARVKIIQRFDALNIPQIDMRLLREFRLYLADLDIKNKSASINKEQEIRLCNSSDNYRSATGTISQSYQWIEDKLLQTPIPDHRKFTIELLLAPYLVNIRHLSSFNEVYSIIEDWAQYCNTLRTLEPSVNDFLDYRIKLAIEKSTQNCIPPIKRETMKKNYYDWYKDFEDWHLFS
jgi:hypothetical protein